MFDADRLPQYVACYMLFVFLAAGAGVVLGRRSRNFDHRYHQVILTTYRNIQDLLMLGIIGESLLIVVSMLGSGFELPDIVTDRLRWCTISGAVFAGTMGLLYGLLCGMLDGLGIPRHAPRPVSNP